MEIFSVETKTNPFRAFRIRLGFVVSPPGRNFPRGGCCFLSFDVCCVSLAGRQAGERPSDPHPLPGDRLEDGEARRGVLPARHRLQREDDRRTRPESHGRHGDPIGRRWGIQRQRLQPSSHLQAGVRPGDVVSAPSDIY
jgi:hypothetical protein